MVTLLSESTSRIGKLERPQEFVGLLEFRTNSINLVNQIFHADDTMLTKPVLNNAVVCNRNTFSLDLGKPTLIDQFAHCLEVRVTIEGEKQETLKTC